ncbi:hypothetical protein HY605_04670 [Candidatus Peregrinibacteria bacterium]|nr:hypothetical protein [Candidatus Peregrinibacteria bacterium]
MRMSISKWAVVLFFICTVGVFAQDNKQNGNAASVKPGDVAKEKLKEFKTAFGKSKSEAEKTMLIQGLQDIQSKEILSELSKIAKGDKMEEVRKTAIRQIGDRYRGKEAVIALKDAFVSAARTQIKEIQVLAVEQMGKMATPPVVPGQPKNVRQTTVYKPEAKTLEYASIFLNWLITTYVKDLDVDIAVAALNSIGKLRSQASVDPLLAFLKYYENLQGQLSQQVQQVDSSKLAEMRDKAMQQAQQAKAAKAPQTTTTTTTSGGSAGTDMDAAKAAAMQQLGMGTGDKAADAKAYNDLVGGAADSMRGNAASAKDALAGTGMEDLAGLSGGMADFMDSIVNMNGTVGGNAPTTTTTTTTTGGSPGGASTPSSTPTMNASDALVTTGQTYAQRFPQLDARCKKLIPATVSSLKGVTKQQSYYGWADWTKWWDRNKGIWKPE